MNNSFDINILVNGNRCKQYHHDGKTFIQANHGSEYELEIKNNTWGKVLCLSSVDGLSVITGNTATLDDPGYIIPSYSPLRIKGFRYSNDEVAAFKFTCKGNSYAQSTGGSEAARNCGIIGFQLYNEVVKPLPMWNITWSDHPSWGTGCDPKWGDQTLCRSNMETYDNDSIKCFNGLGGGTLSAGPTYGKGLSCQGSGQMKKSSSPLRAKSFDMGSTWGQKVESKVVETNFEKGILAWSVDIYYASRQSLIDMGVPINVGHQVSFPQSFPNKYATPPSGWRG